MPIEALRESTAESSVGGQGSWRSAGLSREQGVAELGCRGDPGCPASPSRRQRPGRGLPGGLDEQSAGVAWHSWPGLSAWPQPRR